MKVIYYCNVRTQVRVPDAFSRARWTEIPKYYVSLQRPPARAAKPREKRFFAWVTIQTWPKGETVQGKSLAPRAQLCTWFCNYQLINALACIIGLWCMLYISRTREKRQENFPMTTLIVAENVQRLLWKPLSNDHCSDHGDRWDKLNSIMWKPVVAWPIPAMDSYM